jgi:transketolase
MRVDFVNAVSHVIEKDPSSVFITGDLGYNALEGIAKMSGKRFLNAGVAEQNMMGLAAGIALTGYKPWVYSIAPFVTYRCLEQIRNDICLHDLPVRIVGNGGGYTYGVLGSTHHALEDFAVLKALPNLTLYFPCANDQVSTAVEQIHLLDGPSYLRLAISPYSTSLQPLRENPVTLTRSYSEGDSVTLIGVGHGVQVALSALSKSPEIMKNAAIFGIAKFPFNLEKDEILLKSVIRTQHVIVIEEHYASGGMGESLKMKLPNTETFQVMSAHYTPGQRYGSPAYHTQQCGLTPDHLIDKVQRLLK